MEFVKTFLLFTFNTKHSVQYFVWKINKREIITEKKIFFFFFERGLTNEHNVRVIHYKDLYELFQMSTNQSYFTLNKNVQTISLYEHKEGFVYSGSLTLRSTNNYKLFWCILTIWSFIFKMCCVKNKMKYILLALFVWLCVTPVHPRPR